MFININNIFAELNKKSLIAVIPAQAGIHSQMSVIAMKTGINNQWLSFQRLRLCKKSLMAVIPAEAGIHNTHEYWIPASAGMTHT